MSSLSLDDTAMTSSSSVTRDVNHVLRLNGVKTNPRYFGFRWKQRNTDEISTSRKLDVNDLSSENSSNSKISNGFLKNIRKRWRMKNLSLCKVKQKIIGLDSQRNSVDAQASNNDKESLSFFDEKNPVEPNERVNCADSGLSLSREVNQLSSNREADACWNGYSPLENGHEETEALSRELRSARSGENEENNPESENKNDPAAVQGGNIAEPQSTNARESIETIDGIVDGQITNENRAKVNLSEELLKLSKYGWYWGPISGDEADSKLVCEPDGAFLVRDSSDDRYLLTLSFKSSGRLLHARMEHSGGLFSLCNQGDNEGFTSVAALIDHSMNSSQSAVFCYSRPKYPGYPSFPVRLMKPVSRFTQRAISQLKALI